MIPQNRKLAKISMIVFQKIVVVLFSSCIGMIGGTVVTTPVIALMNYLATDGPYFPPPLIAWAFFALPIAFLLLPIQVLLVISEAISRKALKKKPLLLLAVTAGLGTVIIWNVVLASSPIIFWMLIVNCICGVFQASLVFTSHWIAYNSIKF